MPDNLKSNLFVQEEVILKKAGKALAASKQSGTASYEELESLFKGYERMYNQLRILVKTSDRLQLKLNILKDQLEIRNRFIKNTFGRYLSDDIVNVILESPEGTQPGGEKREVTILMSDLRGFSGITDRLPAESVVTLLNMYLEVMTEVIFKHNGTIDEFTGDGILAVFGAPLQQPHHARQAVASALEMQLAMKLVNEKNRAMGLPELEMGIGINTGELVVGNIGSTKRMKYGVVGVDVNMTARIESYTSGGQIFISKSTKDKCGSILDINRSMEVRPKGVDEPITIYDITGIRGDYGLAIPVPRPPKLKSVEPPLPVVFSFVTEKHVDATLHKGSVVNTGDKIAQIKTTRKVRKFSDLKVTFLIEGLKDGGVSIYGKVIDNFKDNNSFLIRFSSIPPGARNLF